MTMATKNKPFRVTKKAAKAELARRAGDTTITRAPQPLLRLWGTELAEIAAASGKDVQVTFATVSARRFDI